MKNIKRLVVATVMSCLFNELQAQVPDIYNNRILQPPIPPSAMQYRNFGRIWVDKGMDQEGYKLRIYISGEIDPESIQVKIVGHTIIIENKQSLQQEERSEQGFYSYSSSSRNFRRRFSIPRDADPENMKRTVENGVITITLPFLYTRQQE